MNKLSIICNSNNPDLVMYFTNKVNAFNNDVYFLGNKQLAKELNIDFSSVSKVSGLTIWFVADCFLALLCAYKLLLRKVNVVIFDTAHISNIPLAILCKLFRIKLIFTVHDWNPHEGTQERNVRLYNKFVDRFLADEYITFSKVKSRLKVNQLKLSGFTKKSASQPQGYYLFFGRIEPYKGLKHLVNIAKGMLELGLNEKIIIAGKGDDSSIKELSDLPNVVMKNRFIPDDELENLVQGSIATLLPYDSATQSGVILHSYSYSKPVVAFDVGALHEYIKGGVNGMLVEHGNIYDFIEKMKIIRDDYDNFEINVSKEFKHYDKSALEKQYRLLLQNLNILLQKVL